MVFQPTLEGTQPTPEQLVEGTSNLYDELRNLLGQLSPWADSRHLQTLSWLVVGLLCSGCISLTKWGSYIHTRAVFAQSRQRRFSRWLHNPRINPQKLYSPVITHALSQWNHPELLLILDTSMLWNRYCLVRVCVQYRGRAVPVAWRVLEHGSSSIAFAEYRQLLARVHRLLPIGVRVVFLADRGFADTCLMAYLKGQLGWHYRIRVKCNFSLYRPGRRPVKVHDFHLRPGQALLLQGVKLTQTKLAPCVNLALGCDPLSKEYWYIVSDETTTLQTFREYGLRFDIEENFLDDKSNGFELERSQLRSAPALSRLCLVLAVATLYLTAQGERVVAAGKRRWVDAHWHRGNSYLRIGWEWVKSSLTRGWQRFMTLCLSGGPDPEPARASQKQWEKQFLREFQVHSCNYVT